MHKLLHTLAAIFALLWLAACGTEPANIAPEPNPIGAEVAVTGGVVLGIVGEDGLKQYHGIPYAAAPIGERRWAPSQPVEPWPVPKDAGQPGPACMQPQGVGANCMAKPVSRWMRIASR